MKKHGTDADKAPEVKHDEKEPAVLKYIKNQVINNWETSTRRFAPVNFTPRKFRPGVFCTGKFHTRYI